MFRFIVTRLGSAVIVLLSVSVLVVLLVRLMPGDAASAILGDQATPESIARVRAELGIDRPVYSQYLDWLGAALQGDLGRSLVTSVPVTEAISDRLSVTVWLSVTSLVVALVLGVALGTAAALRAGGRADRIVSAGTAFAVAVPHFWLALVMVLLFSLKLEWLPATGYVALGQDPAEWARGLVMPVTALALGPTAIIARQTRSTMVDILQRDYITAAQGRGIRLPRLIGKHALKNAAIPIVTSLGLIASVLVGGTVFIELVFAMPGIGQLLITAVQSRDLPVIQGVITCVAAVVVLVNLLVDLSYGWLNPRTRTA
ncbi:ABC transporter permease [Streptomyces phaeolivaceus]|uniref:ABC transporter permease n=1 Tax=Streptomyces phaeolivaceus TaxID=2653200 RepID=A0A5P8KGH1_9ACTN|nr:ABC transporter permease [Streptomyces phaeolivaceus]QFR01728.1 ABC transporter permease [Streptomyces phaeolivaceus]